MFTSKHYINNIALLASAFTNSLLILIISNDLRLAAFLFFLGYIIVFPALSLINREGVVQKSRIIVPVLFLFLLIFLALLFIKYNAAGIIPALAFIFYCIYLSKESGSNLELIIRMFMLLSAPVLIFEILFNGTYIPAVLLLIIIIYLQDRISETVQTDYNFYLLSVLTGGILVVSPALIIPYMFFIFYVFRGRLVRLLSFLAVSILTFTLVTWQVSEGMIMEYLNYYLNSSLLFTMPVWVLILYGIILFYTAWITADLQEVYFTSALFIAVPVIIMLALNLFDSGIEGLREQNYLNELQITVPLFITAVKDYRVDLFAGKIIPP